MRKFLAFSAGGASLLLGVMPVPAGAQTALRIEAGQAAHGMPGLPKGSNVAPTAVPGKRAGHKRTGPLKHGLHKQHGRRAEVGKASYYSRRFVGHKTASGHPYSPDAYTGAHRSLPLGTWVKVTNLTNRLAVIVQITDRGPFGAGHRIIDLSRRAALDLGMARSGVVPVSIEVVQGQAMPGLPDAETAPASAAL